MLASSKAHTSRFISANLPCNKFKNRLVNIMPYESTRVCLQPIRGVEGSDYINASFIDGYRCRAPGRPVPTHARRPCPEPGSAVHPTGAAVTLTHIRTSLPAIWVARGTSGRVGTFLMSRRELGSGATGGTEGCSPGSLPAPNVSITEIEKLWPRVEC